MIKYLFFLIVFALCSMVRGQTLCFSKPNNSPLKADSVPFYLTSADFNGDTNIDLAIANINSNNISVLIGNGLGDFSNAVNYSVGISPTSVLSADFNSDGKADLAVTNGGSKSISILLGNGLGSFTTTVNFMVDSIPYALTSADFNGDSKIDLAVANEGSNNVSVLLGNGLGSFANAVNFAVDSMPLSIISSDFNGDAKADLAVVNFGSNNVSVLLGNGAGSFAPFVGFSVWAEPTSLTGADFNMDGKADLAVAISGSGNAAILLGNGAGSFSPAVYYPAGWSPYSITSADFNGDNKPDLAVASYNPAPHVASVLLGTGTGSFATQVIFKVDSLAISIISADFNRDGKVDLATANMGSNNVSLLLNRPMPTVTYTLSADTAPHTWSAYTVYSTAVDSARWYWGDGTCTIGLYPSHTYSVAGRYNICVTAYSSCGDSAQSCQNDTVYRASSSTMVYINVDSSSAHTTGISQISGLNSQVFIYPNPNNGLFVIEPSSVTKQTMQVYDVNGKLVLSQTINGKTTIDANNLNEGIYNISLQSTEGVVNKRVVIVR